MNSELGLSAQAFVMRLVIDLIPVVIAGVAVWLAARKPQVTELVSSVIPQDIQYEIERAAELAAKAAEQTGFAKKLKDEFLNKKEFALDYAQKLLDAKGLSGIDVKLIDGAIEAAVGMYFGKGG